MPVPAKPLNRLRQLWSEGRPAFGAIATIPSVQMVQIMARSLDWIIVDLEHGPIAPKAGRPSLHNWRRRLSGFAGTGMG